MEKLTSVFCHPLFVGSTAFLAGWFLKRLCSPPPKSIDHCELRLSCKEDLERYLALLAPLGVKHIMSVKEGLCLGVGVKVPDLWLVAQGYPAEPVHIAFPAINRRKVDEWYDNALKLGFIDNGPPGLRKIYHPHYYGAFVLDPINKHNLEAVCHYPPIPFQWSGRKDKRE
eukprot:gb/GEZN01023021.1/.p1 GENE.gb/GEZN01023021.1/~~gb/GEZN01023021.1/.p1  ORF type:complete len:170 (+),score=18.14 gb/GEZN01023021.1/:52-561(+)